MKRKLSSLQTFIVKIIFPGFWLIGGGAGMFSMFFGQSEIENEASKWLFLFFWAAGALLLYWTCMRLKAVSVDERFLYVSNYIKEIAIPLSQISDVTENRWLNNRPVTIHLKSPSEFGDKITFMPKVKAF